PKSRSGTCFDVLRHRRRDRKRNQPVFGGTPNAGMMDEIENPNPDPKTNNWYSRRREIYLLAANARSCRALRSSLVRSTLIGHELNVGSPAKAKKDSKRRAYFALGIRPAISYGTK